MDYPALNDASVERLQGILDAGLPAVNPLDAWGNGGAEAGRYMENCFVALMSDPGHPPFWSWFANSMFIGITTGMVFLMVIVAAIFFLLVDQLLAIGIQFLLRVGS